MLRWQFMVVQLLTTLRVAAAMLFACVALIPGAHPIALGLYALALASDLADGYFARRLHCRSRFGEHYDGFADKAVDIVSVVYNAVQGAPVVACALILIRHVVALSIRAATGNRHAGSRIIGALTGASIRVITILVLVLPGTARWAHSYGIWIAATVSLTSASREIWTHRTQLSALMSPD